MTPKEFEERRRRLDDQLAAGIALLREAHAAQVRALELVRLAAGGEPGPPEVRRTTAERRPRSATGQLYQEVVALLSRLPAEFTKDDVLRALGHSPNRVSLFRVLQKAEAAGRIEVARFGVGRVPTVFRRKDEATAAERS